MKFKVFIGFLILLVSTPSMSQAVTQKELRKPHSGKSSQGKEGTKTIQLYKDPADEKIKNELRRAWAKRQTRLVMLGKDSRYIGDGYIDERILRLLDYISGTKKHTLAIRLRIGYDDEEHALSRETAYTPGDMPNISAHFKGQAIDIFIADGVEIAWQTSKDPLKRRKAQDKIREILKEIFAVSYKNRFLCPIQMLVYNHDDVNFFAKDIYTLYGRTREERGLRGLMSGPRYWDRIHIGY